MKAARIFSKMRKLNNGKAEKLPRMHWQRWGEHISRNGHTVTELEVHTHQRLAAQSQVERLSR